MSKQESLLRYTLIISKVNDAPTDFETIHNYLEAESTSRAYHLTMSKRTFKRDLDDIRSLYDIDIQFNFKTKKYFIEDRPETATLNMRMLEAFELYQALQLNNKVAAHISFEIRKPQGVQYMFKLLKAIKEKQIIEIQHKKFEEVKVLKKILEPLAIKESRGRWYLVAYVKDEKHIRTFGLDRILDLELKNKKFTPIPFDIKDYYNYCFGIIRPEKEDPQDVVISFKALQAQYIKSYPLHHSQEIIKEDENETHFKLKLNITFDFVQELLSHGNLVKIIKPKSIISDFIKKNLIK